LAEFAPQISEKDLAETVTAAAARYFEGRRSRGRRLRVFAIGAAAAAAAVIIGVFFAVSTGPKTDAPPAMLRCAATEPVEVTEGVFLNHCVDRPVQAVVGSDGNVQVTVYAGAVGVSVNPNRTHKNKVSVHTRFGTVTVKGTVFTVHVSENDARVEVFRGTVEIQPEAADATLLVTQNNGALLEAGGRYKLQAATTNSLWTKLTARSSETGDSQSPDPDENRLALGIHSPVDTGLDSSAGDKSVVSAALDEERENESPLNEEPITKGGRISSLDRLLMEARSCLLDEDWTCAAARYKNIVRNYENRWESMSALISLAKIELRHLGKPRQALDHFATYMKRFPGGPLLEEAVFGMAECHRRLGNRDKELEILHSYIETHPSNLSTDKMKKRIQELKAH
jgi:TolA-binding protein